MLRVFSSVFRGLKLCIQTNTGAMVHHHTAAAAEAVKAATKITTAPALEAVTTAQRELCIQTNAGAMVHHHRAAAVIGSVFRRLKLCIQTNTDDM